MTAIAILAVLIGPVFFAATAIALVAHRLNPAHEDDEAWHE